MPHRSPSPLGRGPRPAAALLSLAGLCSALGAPALGQQSENTARLSVALMSDYMKHGLSQSGSKPSLRFMTDYAHRSGFFAGGFLVNVEYRAEQRFRKPRDLQANVYAGYLWRAENWAANASVSRYIYPGLEISYDYTQTDFHIAFKDRFFFDVSHSRNFLSLYRSAIQYRAGAVFPWLKGIEVGLNAGRFRASEPLGASYTYWDAGLSRAVGRFALDLRYHDTGYGGTTLLGDGGSRWVLSASYAIAPRARH